LALMTHLRQSGLLFVGDDVTDEQVFGLTEGFAMGILSENTPILGRRFISSTKERSRISSGFSSIASTGHRSPSSLMINEWHRDDWREAAHER